MSYTAILITHRGLTTAIVLADGEEIGRTELAARDSTLAQAQDITRSHRDGWLTVERVDLDDAA